MRDIHLLLLQSSMYQFNDETKQAVTKLSQLQLQKDRLAAVHAILPRTGLQAKLLIRNVDNVTFEYVFRV